MKHYNANDFANRTFRYKKYLLPAASLMPWLPRQAAPKIFCELPKPGHEKSDSASACGLFHYERIFTAESSESPATFVSAYVDGEVRELTVDRSEEHAQMVYCFEHGGCVGRNGCLVTSHNQAVRETAFLGKYGVQGVKRFSKLDPRYWIHRQRGNLTARRTIPAPQRVSGAAISMNNCSSHNFFHWLTEVAPRAIAAAQMVPLSTTKLIVDHQFAYQREILQLLGTTPSQWIQPHCHLHIQPFLLLWCNEPTPALLRAFASQIRNQIPRRSDLPKKIYISRKKASHRKLVNEEEVEQCLHKQGFTTFDFESLPIRSQIEIVASADEIVSLHGAALAHLIFAAPNTKVVELFPENRQNFDLYPRFSRMMGLRHSLVLAKQSKHGQQLTVQCSDLLNALNAR